MATPHSKTWGKLKNGDAWSNTKTLASAFTNPFDSDWGPKAALEGLGLLPDSKLQEQAIERSQQAWDVSGQYRDASIPYADQYNAVFGAQAGLADSLNDTINNPYAQSVAREQLAQTQQANEAAQASMASGVGGQNGFMARRNAANNVAGLNAKAGQDAALLRAQETAAAQQNMGAVLGNMQSGATGMYGKNTDAGAQYANTSGTLLKNGTDANAAGAQGFAGMAGGLIGAISDPDAKTNIGHEDPSAIDSVLAALQPSEFNYKDDEIGEPRRHGIMTTDLKRSSIGRSLVRKTPGGYEGYDVAQGMGALMASAARLHQRMNAIEGRNG
jgi:hypothetical protein